MGNPSVTMDELAAGVYDGSRSLLFATWVRVVATAARAKGLDVPGYRSPPRVAGRDRTIRGTPGEASGCTVAVRIEDRPAIDVALDLIDGLAWANDIGAGHPDIGYVRAELLTSSGLAGATRTRPPR